jgi:two-component system OmpR family response regulator/two-component system response regulator RstA
VLNVLVVEDDPSLASWMSDYLTENGYLVTLANQGDYAISIIEDDQPDLVILDINLPEVNGFDVCRSVRQFYTAPILMLTARSEESDEVDGLECGANDYMVKPVRPRALLARIARLLKTDISTDRLAVGGLCIDLSSRTVTLNAATVELSSNEFDLLCQLVEHAGEVRRREQLVENLRGIEYDGFNRSVDILVSRLRRKLHDDATSPTRIKTVWGKGYLLAADAW